MNTLTNSDRFWPTLSISDQLWPSLIFTQFSAVKFGRMTKCQRELLLDQAESYRNEMEKKHKEMSKFDFNSTGERSDLSDSSGSNQSSPDCKPFILNSRGDRYFDPLIFDPRDWLRRSHMMKFILIHFLCVRSFWSSSKFWKIFLLLTVSMATSIIFWSKIRSFFNLCLIRSALLLRSFSCQNYGRRWTLRRWKRWKTHRKL